MFCVDEVSGLVNDDNTTGEPFFDDNQELSAPLKAVFDFVSQVEQNLAATHKATAALADAQLLSMGNLARLEQLAKMAAQPAPAAPKSGDLEDLFKDDGTVIG